MPGDKSLSHRALILGALAEGENKVTGWLDAGDTRATLGAMRRLGLEIDKEGNTLTFYGGRLQAPSEAIDCKNSGTTIRLLAGLLAGQPFETVLDGSEQLRKRPMRRVSDPLGLMGAKIAHEDGNAPLMITPAKLEGREYELKVASAQVKSALLLGGWYAEGETVIREPGPSRDHTERMLTAMGAEIKKDGLTTRLTIARPALKPLDFQIPGDISSAAFVIVAACIVPGSDVVIENVGLNPTRTGVLDILIKMGAEIEILETWESGGEPMGNLWVRYSTLKGVIISGDEIVRAIDELPVIAVAATQAEGQTIIKDAQELRVKEVDRIEAMVQNLQAMGVEVEEKPDGMVLQGEQKLHGAMVGSAGDHRIGMAMAVAGMVAEGVTEIEEADAIEDSFPGFTETMAALGAKFA